MREYTVVRKEEELNWATVPCCGIDNLLWTEPVDIGACAQLCWDEEALYVRLQARETNIRAELKGIMQEVYEDSCLEFFFRPDGGFRYFNFEFNPNESLYLGFGEIRDLRPRLIVKSEQEIFRPSAKRTDEGWEISYRIPVRFIQQFVPEFSLYSGLELYGNFYKCGDKTEKPHFLAWNHIELETPSFHCPEFFGLLRFE